MVLWLFENDVPLQPDSILCLAGRVHTQFGGCHCIACPLRESRHQFVAPVTSKSFEVDEYIVVADRTMRRQVVSVTCSGSNVFCRVEFLKIRILVVGPE